jgi:integrase
MGYFLFVTGARDCRNWQQFASRLLPGGQMTDRFEWDPKLTGFGKRTSDGRETWVIQYRLGHKQRRMTIGTCAKLTQAQAREQARKRLAQVELGQDPAADKRQSRTEAKHTLRSVIAQYLEAKQGAVRPRTYVEVCRYLNDHWAPLHSVPVNAVRRADVALELSKMIRKNGSTAAARARVALSAFYVWAMGEGIAEANPVIGTNKPSEPPARDRVLSDAELAAVWHTAGDGDYGRIVRLLILTGCRRLEIGGLRWTEIDSKERVIRLPAERVKNGRPHDVPLTDLAWSILQEQPVIGEHVFGPGGTGFRAWFYDKKGLDERLGEKVAAWTVHDTRRTLATRLADLGVMPHVIEAVLNHQSGHKRGPAGVYNRSRYDREVRNALALWSDHVRALIEGGERKVIALSR